MKIHELKIAPEYFNQVMRGVKKFEIRKNDRDFKKGDLVILNEYKSRENAFTNKSLVAQIGYILERNNQNQVDGLMVGYCIFGISGVSFFDSPEKMQTYVKKIQVLNKI